MSKRNSIICLTFILLLSLACDRSKKEFETAKKIGTIAAYEHFIANNQESEFIQEATMILDSLNFQEVMKLDSIPLYEDFIAKNPMSPYIKNANSRVEEIRFEEVKKKDSIDDYHKFINKYPQSQFIQEVNRILKEKNNSLTQTNLKQSIEDCLFLISLVQGFLNPFDSSSMFAEDEIKIRIARTMLSNLWTKYGFQEQDIAEGFHGYMVYYGGVWYYDSDSTWFNPILVLYKDRKNFPKIEMRNSKNKYIFIFKENRYDVIIKKGLEVRLNSVEWIYQNGVWQKNKGKS
jgi:hypothetical protein